jgi:hypothetical protein
VIGRPGRSCRPPGRRVRPHWPAGYRSLPRCFPLKATVFGDLQRITGGLLTEMALVMSRTGRRADILFCMVPGRGDLLVRCRRCDHRRVFPEARQALLMEFRIGNRTALLAHPRLAESAVRLQHSSVMVAMHDVLPGRRGIGIGGHGQDRRQASRCESQTGRNLKNHDDHLRVGARDKRIRRRFGSA